MAGLVVPALLVTLALVHMWHSSVVRGGLKAITRKMKHRVEGQTVSYSLLVVFSCAVSLADITALAAQSVMGSPPPIMMGSPPPTALSFAPTDAAATPEAATPKPKQKGPPGAVTVINASAKTVTGVVITAGDQTATLPKPLTPKARTSIKLPKIKGCTVSVAATFDGGSKSDSDAFDICKEKLIRFTEP